MAEVEDTQGAVTSGTLPHDTSGERRPAPHPCPATRRPAQADGSPTRLHSDFSSAGGLCRGPRGTRTHGTCRPLSPAPRTPGYEGCASLLLRYASPTSKALTLEGDGLRLRPLLPAAEPSSGPRGRADRTVPVRQTVAAQSPSRTLPASPHRATAARGLPVRRKTHQRPRRRYSQEGDLVPALTTAEQGRHEEGQAGDSVFAAAEDEARSAPRSVCAGAAFQCFVTRWQ